MFTIIKYATKEHESYAIAICELIESAAKKRGTRYGVHKSKNEKW